MAGYIKLYRNLLDNPVMQKPDYLSVWIYLLLKANHKITTFIFNNKTIELQPGQLVTGRKKLSRATGISESQIYKILNYFEMEHQIEQQKNNRFTLISILNWQDYQGNGTTKEQQSNSKVTTTRQPRNTYKNDKNVKNEKNSIICSDLKAKSEPQPSINFNFDTSKWEGITDSDIDLWGKAYPAAVLDIEFAKMKSWILANGAKGKKKNWRAFITRWLTKCQDYGGTKNADVR